jgi:DNA-binding NarL/FixJ family response regulator
MTRLLESVLDAYQGGSPMSTTVASRVLKLFQQVVPRYMASPVQDEYDLSAREREILLYMTEGKDLRAIGEACFISYETVRTHVKKIYRKLHVASASEAVAKAIKQNLV